MSLRQSECFGLWMPLGKLLTSRCVWGKLDACGVKWPSNGFVDTCGVNCCPVNVDVCGKLLISICMWGKLLVYFLPLGNVKQDVEGKSFL